MLVGDLNMAEHGLDTDDANKGEEDAEPEAAIMQSFKTDLGMRDVFNKGTERGRKGRRGLSHW